MTVSERDAGIVGPTFRAPVAGARTGRAGNAQRRYLFLSNSSEVVMSDLNAVEIKAFVPARDFGLCQRFYEDLGFTVAWSDADLAYLRCDGCSFLLQNFYNP